MRLLFAEVDAAGSEPDVPTVVGEDRLDMRSSLSLELPIQADIDDRRHLKGS